MLSKIIIRISGVFCLCTALTCIAGDDRREAQIAQEVQKTLDVGHAIWLDATGKKFLGLHTDTTKNPRAGMIILLHDMGGNPNQQAVIKNLRTFFPEHHWATLSIQLPIREVSAPVQDYYSLFPEAKTRVLEAIKFAKAQKSERVVVIGYGLGGLTASYALSDLKTHDVDALVTISLPVPETNELNAQTLQIIPKLTLPMLDIYGENDEPNVVKNARDKKVAGKINPYYRQAKIDNEGHLFLHDDGILVKRIYSWLGSEELKKLAQTKITDKKATESPQSKN